MVGSIDMVKEEDGAVVVHTDELLMDTHFSFFIFGFSTL